MFGLGAIIPELDVFITFSANYFSLSHSQSTFFEQFGQVAFPTQYVLQRRLLVHEDVEMIGDNMTT